MKKKILSLVVIIFTTSTMLFAQNNPWKSIKSRGTNTPSELLSRPNLPKDFQVLALDANQLKSETNKTTKYNVAAQRIARVPIIVSMPTPKGDFINFEIFEQQDFEEGLAKKYPNLKSYTGFSTTDKATKIDFTVNALGFNAVITSPYFSTIYIDSYTKNLDQYIIYYRKDLELVKDFTCLDNNINVVDEPKSKSQQFVKRSTDGVYRDYRIAIACTTEYSEFHINRVNGQNKTLEEKKEIVLSAIQTSINRVNAVYKRDLAIHLTLVKNNDDIIFITSDNFNNTNANILINQSQTVINNIIGDANYDIGHTFSTGAGGLAYLYTPCDSNTKAKGVTGSSQPVNDPYDIDYVAHEIGHQFGATHTFNNSCGTNRQDETAYEPGSGSTIMAYAGICAPNVANNSDDYFHFISIEQITNFITTDGTCSINTPLNNTAPSVSNLTNYVIPNGTAFKLSIEATDIENDILTYTWDQLNNEIVVNPPVATATKGPSFKSLKPSTNAVRYFPDYQTVLNGSLASEWEVVPTVARILNFGITVRDNNVEAGQITQKENTITVASTGPFKITSPDDETTSWEKNSTQTITWDVAGTTSNGINVATVNILLSTDGGNTFEILAQNTPNDGTETITVPNIATKNARIMIEANDNIFYALSKSINIGYKLIIENFCNDYTLAYNALNIANTNTFYNFTFDVNEVEDFEIRNIKLSTDIVADQTADVNIYFKNSGDIQTYSTIVYRNTQCNSTQNLKSIFDNSGTTNTCGNVNTSTILKPNENFTGIGKQANGEWNVLLSKNNANRNVRVNKLILSLCGEKRTYLDINNNNTNKNSFAVYPNPSNGEFKFFLESKNNIQITIFDITGKLLINKTYKASNANVHDINLAMLAQGVYIFKVNDGSFKKTEKIIIN